MLPSRQLWCAAMFFAGVAMAGCSNVTYFRGVHSDEKFLFLTGLPPIVDDSEHGCGAVCVATVVSYWGEILDLKAFSGGEALQRDLCAKDLARMGRSAGLCAYAYGGSMDDLQTNLRKGRPLIVMIRKPVDPSTRYAYFIQMLLDNPVTGGAHWVTVIGIRGNGNVIIQDPSLGRLVVDRDLFENWWESKKNISVLIAPAARGATRPSAQGRASPAPPAKPARLSLGRPTRNAS